jgi:hypothetical protein
VVESEPFDLHDRFARFDASPGSYLTQSWPTWVASYRQLLKGLPVYRAAPNTVGILSQLTIGLFCNFDVIWFLFFDETHKAILAHGLLLDQDHLDA